MRAVTSVASTQRVAGRSPRPWIVCLAMLSWHVPPAFAQAPSAPATVSCAAPAGQRVTCVADTSNGVSLVTSVEPGACVLGTTWGFDEKGIWVSDGCGGEFAAASGNARADFGTYEPGRGFTVASTPRGVLALRVYTYLRYLNQRALDAVSVDSFGTVRTVKQRQDLQVNKITLNMLGWLLDPKLGYVFYVWTSNTAQGQSAQVVVAGNLTYAFSRHVTLGVGINGLPGVRSNEGNFPHWLGVDNRLIADTYFQPSYTTGIFTRGEIVSGLRYQAMLGNNLSQLGVDAGQLGNDMNTFAGSLVWMPTTGEFGPASSFGDFDGHARPATRVGAHYTRSDEDRQSQPDTEAIENVQIRIADGNIVFTPGLFGPEIAVSDVVYRMVSVDAGVKYRGLSLEGEYYWRTVDDFRGVGVDRLPFDRLADHGFQLQTSAMLMPRQLQVYVSGSRVFGEYGEPFDTRVGVNVYPWQNQVVRWNNELLYLERSPVGALSLPYPVGGNGPVFSSNLEVNF